MYLLVVLEVVEAEPEPGISLPKLLVPSANGQEALLLQQLGSWAWQGRGCFGSVPVTRLANLEVESAYIPAIAPTQTLCSYPDLLQNRETKNI